MYRLDWILNVVLKSMELKTVTYLPISDFVIESNYINYKVKLHLICLISCRLMGKLYPFSWWHLLKNSHHYVIKISLGNPIFHGTFKPFYTVSVAKFGSLCFGEFLQFVFAHYFSFNFYYQFLYLGLPEIRKTQELPLACCLYKLS